MCSPPVLSVFLAAPVAGAGGRVPPGIPFRLCACLIRMHQRTRQGKGLWCPMRGTGQVATIGGWSIPGELVTGHTRRARWHVRYPTRAARIESPAIGWIAQGCCIADRVRQDRRGNCGASTGSLYSRLTASLWWTGVWVYHSRVIRIPSR